MMITFKPSAGRATQRSLLKRAQGLKEKCIRISKVEKKVANNDFSWPLLPLESCLITRHCLININSISRHLFNKRFILIYEGELK